MASNYKEMGLSDRKHADWLLSQGTTQPDKGDWDKALDSAEKIVWDSPYDTNMDYVIKHIIQKLKELRTDKGGE